MKRKPWGGLLLALALAVCLSLLPTTAQAAEHTHAVCGASCSHNGAHSADEITWEGISAETALTAAGTTGGYYYYLTTDITLTSTWEPTQDVTLCLNGHSITMENDGPTILVNSGSLTLTDCQEGKKEYGFCEAGGRWIRTEEGTPGEDDIIVTSGFLTHASNKTGTGVLIGTGNTFTMYGGAIVGNKAEEGGGVSVGGTFCMYGGTVTGNTTTGNGGGVYAAKGNLTISGGSITNNTAGGNGGGVYVNSGTVNLSGTVSGNNAANGGGVYVNDGTVNLSGTVTGNTAASGGKGAGVYVGDAQSSTVNLSGGAEVKDNRIDGTASNIYLPGGKEVYVTGALTGNGTIGVTLENPPAAVGGHVMFAQGGNYALADADAEAFFYDAENAGDSVMRVGNALWLVRGQLHRHTVCTADGCAESGHTSGHDTAVFEKLTYDNGALVYPGGYSSKSGEGYSLSSGTYYLPESITLDAPLIINNCNVTLCLNGKSITSTAAGKAVIQIVGTGKLTLCDCKGGGESYGTITHAAQDAIGNKYTGSGVYVLGENTAFTMYGGSISGNRSNDVGAGVYVYTSAAFTMYGGEISGNSSTSQSGGGICTYGTTIVGGSAKITGNMANSGRGGGVYVGSGTLTLQGRAEVTGNSASNVNNGCGIYVDNGMLQVSGKVQVTGNQRSENEVSNVYLTDSQNIRVVGALTGGENGARIGVSVSDAVRDAVKAGSPKIIARVSNAAAQAGITIPSGCFTVDGWTIFDLRPTDGDKNLQLRHDHAWVYEVTTAANPTIRAKCSASTCGFDGGEVWLEDGSYNYDAGNPQGPVPKTTNWTAGTLKTVYVTADGTKSDTRPGAVGDYTVRVTVLKEDNTPATDANGVPVQIERTFEIGKGQLTKDDFEVSMPTNAVYNGQTVWTATITPRAGLEGVGAIEPWYLEETPNGLALADPKNAGTYVVKFDVAEGSNYGAAGRMQDSAWTFTVKQVNYDYSIPDQEIVAGCRVSGIAVPEGGTGVRLSTGSDEIVAGTLTWYSNESRTTTLAGDDVLSGQVGSSITLYWTFQPSAPSYIGDPNYNYKAEQKTGSVVLTFKEALPQQLRFDASRMDKTYGDDPFTVLARNTSEGGGDITYASSDESIAAVDSSGEVTIKKAGTVTITATAAAVEGKYKETSASYTLTVAKAPIKIEGIIGVETKDYDGGTNATARLLSYIPEMYKAKAGDDVYVVSADVAFTDANFGWDKTVRIDLDSIQLGGADADSYTVDLVNSRTETIGSIRQRELALTHIDRVDKDYDGSAAYPVSGEVFDGLQNGETLVRGVDYTVSAAYWPDADAGQKGVDVTVTLLDTAKARNYVTSGYGGLFYFSNYARINQLVYGDKTDRLDVRYGRSGTKALGGLLAEGCSTAAVYAIEGDTAILSAYSLGADTVLHAAVVNDRAKIGASATIRILVTGVNYEDYFIDVTVTVSSKENVTIYGLTYTDKTYDGQPIAPTGTLTVGGDRVPVHELEVRYTGVGSTVYDSASAPTAAGSYQVTYRVADSNADYTGSATYAFTIGKKAVTVKPKNVTITEGGALPAFELEYSGLVGGDTLTAVPAPQFTVYALDSDTEVLAPAAGSYRICWIDADTALFSDAENYALTRSAVGTLTVTSAPAPTPGGSSGGSTATKTETTTNPDGSTTKTETKPDGTVIETTTGKDGSTTRTETKPDGSSVTEAETANGSTGTVKTDKNGKTEAEAKISGKAVEDAKKSGEAVKVPTEVKAGENSDSAPTVKVELPKDAGKTRIEIPVEDVNSGTVAVIVREDGTEEIVKGSKPTEDGIELAIDGSAAIRIIDNSKDFIDTRNHWSRDEVNFVASREIFNGVGSNLFGVDLTMTRGMVNTVLARLAGVDTTPKAGQKWYEVGTAWAKANGITDGTNPEASVTREQLAAMLYRFAGTPAVSGELNFADADRVSGYAQDALLWATQNGIVNGVGNDRIAPRADAQRVQVAAMMARYLRSAG